MRPLTQFPLAECARIRGVLTDIDDTLTTEGRLPASAYAALERLQQAAFITVAVTGRPAGWCDMIARLWPVDGVVGENGAFYYRYDRARRTMLRRYAVPEADRAASRHRLDALAQTILQRVPGSAIAADQPFRISDLAIDFCEDVPQRLSDADIARIVALFEEAGATAKISSIHVNGWFGAFDKRGMTEALLAEIFAQPAAEAHAHFVYAGDSPNDAPMFEAFRHGVGVANLAPFAHLMAHLPAWITTHPGGAGFAELADLLIGAQGGPHGDRAAA